MIYINTDNECSFPIIPTLDITSLGDIYINIIDSASKQLYVFFVDNVAKVGDLTFLNIIGTDILIENRFYDIKVYADYNGQIVYRDKLFVTNQDLNNFTINNGEYQFPVGIDNNSYIIL